MTSLLHVAPGGSAGGTIRTALGLEHHELLAVHDSLSVGPLVPLNDIEAWRACRRSFWRTVTPARTYEALAAEETVFFSRLSELAPCEQVVFWLAGGLAEQLMLAWLVVLLDTHGGTASKLLLVEYDTLPSGWKVQSIGELGPEDVLHTQPVPRPLTPAERDALKAGWQALTTPDPMGLMRVAAATDTSTCPHFRRSMMRMLARFPARSSGLSYFDERLLLHTHEHGPRAARVIGHTMSDAGDVGDPVGDIWLYWRLRRLGSSSLRRPLVIVESPDPEQLRGTTVTLTDFGTEVLEGRASFLDHNDIAEEIAGVQLDSRAGCLWYRDGESLVQA